MKKSRFRPHWQPATLGLSIALALGSVNVHAIDVSANGYIKNETGVFTNAGKSIGDSTDHAAGDLIKFESSANLFINADISDDLTAHAQLNLMYYQGPDNDQAEKGHISYSQQDYLRELYFDYTIGDTDIRLGKQQVVWGTADGIKLLDIINPTDFREFAQNTMEDSRIPIWMLKAEHSLTDDSSIQFIAAQAKANRIPGLEAEGGGGQAYLLKGVDTITGAENGFLNITPALGSTAFAFTGFAAQFTQGQSGKLESVGGNTFTVQNFIDGFSPFCPGGSPPPNLPLPPGVDSCSQFLNFVAQTPGFGGNENKTNLVTPEYDASNPNSTFEYMSQASFTTFDTFAGAQSKYVRDHPSSEEGNLGFRWKSSINDNFNYSLNYLYRYDSNPSVSIGWEDSQGNPLTSYVTSAAGVTGDIVHSVRLRKADGSNFIANDPLGANDGPATLVFTETLHRVHSLGGAFDTAFDTALLGAVVLRGEFLYDRDVRVPIVDRDALAIGDLANGLRAEKADFIKYVLGLDITVATNMLVSTQLIQFYNLDYIDEVGNGRGKGVNTGRYTGDPAVLHLSNGLQKGEEVETYVSLFLSKPFGASQEGRVNNLLLAESGGGYWNRFDVEYGFTDNFIGSFEWNAYFGDENTTFGQMEKASNVQIGLKYLFE